MYKMYTCIYNISCHRSSKDSSATKRTLGGIFQIPIVAS